MKGKILKVTIVAAFALIAGFNVYNAQKSDVMSDLALAIIFRKHNIYRLRVIFVTDKSKNTEKYEELYILFIITRIEHILHS